MQHQYHWNMVDPASSQGSSLYYHPRHDSEHHHEYDSNLWRSSDGKPSWTELSQPTQLAPLLGPIVYPEVPGVMVPSPGMQNFGPVIPKHEQDTTPDCKYSPTLTDSSLVSSSSTLPTLHSIPTTNHSSHPVSAESPIYWPSYNQPCHLPSHGNVGETHLPTYWHIPAPDTEETSSIPSSGGGRFSEDEARNPEDEEAMVQALLDRPRRTKTTTENAKFHCNECDKGFQRIYNLRSHMIKHEASREKIQCGYSGCGKQFDRKTDLGRHERSVHLHLREHKCLLCGSFFARKDTLVRHIEGSCSKRSGVDRRRLKNLLTPTPMDSDSERR